MISLKIYLLNPYFIFLLVFDILELYRNVHITEAILVTDVTDKKLRINLRLAPFRTKTLLNWNE